MENSRYMKAMAELDLSDEIKNKIIKQVNEEELKKGMLKLKIKNKIIAVLATLGILSSCGVAYATVVPKEWKENINAVISQIFNIDYEEENVTVQEKTVEEILESDKENKELYSVLLDPDTYGIGDGTQINLVESNYNQYMLNVEDEAEDFILKKYNKKINIKLGVMNEMAYDVIDKNFTRFSDTGEVIEREEPSIEELIKFQAKDMKENWKLYSYNENKYSNDLYFEVTGMTIMNGNNTTKEDYTKYSRAKKIKVIFDNGAKEEIINLKDTEKAQFIDLSYKTTGIENPINVEIEVLSTYEGTESSDVYIADIQMGVNSNIPQGR